MTNLSVRDPQKDEMFWTVRCWHLSYTLCRLFIKFYLHCIVKLNEVYN
jgi:hypothetical protein